MSLICRIGLQEGPMAGACMGRAGGSECGGVSYLLEMAMNAWDVLRGGNNETNNNDSNNNTPARSLPTTSLISQAGICHKIGRLRWRANSRINSSFVTISKINVKV